MKKFLSGIVFLITYLNVLATVGIFALMTITVSDVLGRVLFNTPITGVPELAKIAVPAIAFLQIAFVMHKGRHIRSTVIVDLMSPIWATRLKILTHLIGMIVFIMFFIGGWDLMVTAFKVSEYEGEGALRVPTTPNRVFILLGSGLMVILCCWEMVKGFKDLFQKSRNEQT